MNISILLPYKENFSPEYPGAVSLFVYETTRISRFKRDITVYGNTSFKKKFNLKYKNIELKKRPFSSQTKNYVKKFIDLEKINNSTIIEIHNRPSYIQILSKEFDKKIYTLYFHNDPLSMDGSQTILERKNLLKICYRIIFNSSWSKKRFLEGMENKFVNSDKLLIFHQSAKKGSVDLINKKKNGLLLLVNSTKQKDTIYFLHL